MEKEVFENEMWIEEKGIICELRLWEKEDKKRVYINDRPKKGFKHSNSNGYVDLIKKEIHLKTNFSNSAYERMANRILEMSFEN